MDESTQEILNNPIYQKYPRLYLTAELNNLSLEEIDEYVEKIKKHRWCKNISQEGIEVGLKAILVRMNEYIPGIEFKELLEHIKPLQYDHHGVETINRISGKRNFPLLIALIEG